MVLNSELLLIDFLNKYNINLRNKETLECFYSMCDYYEKIVLEKYDENEVHYVGKSIVDNRTINQRKKKIGELQGKMNNLLDINSLEFLEKP